MTTTLTFRTRIAAPVAEGVSPLLAAVITDESGEPLGASELTGLTLTLYDLASGSIVNTRDHVDVLNAHAGTLDESGHFAWQGEAADTALLDSTARLETRVVLLEWTWSTTRAGRHEVHFGVLNLTHVPAPAP